MAINNFIPAVWAARVLENLNKTAVFPFLANREYEGDIRAYGDQVKINNIQAVTIGTYTKNSTVISPETLSDAQRILKIDQSKYFAFEIDDVDKAQQNPKIMEAAMREAAYGLAITADSYIGGLYTECQESNLIGNDTTPETAFTAATDAYNYLVKMSTILDECNVPYETRWVVVPAWFHSLLLLDSRFIDRDPDLRANGRIGRAAGFDIYKSNNIPTATAQVSSSQTTVHHIIAGYSETIAYAEQISSVEAYRPESAFSDAVKGLHLYGAKVVRPDAMCVLCVPRPTSLI